MAVLLRRRERDKTFVLDWPRPPRSKFLESQAFHILKSAVASYVAGDIPGRAILISGRRGAGKTTMVARAVQESAESAFDEVFRLAEDGSPDALKTLRGLGPEAPFACQAVRTEPPRARTAASEEERGGGQTDRSVGRGLACRGCEKSGRARGRRLGAGGEPTK